eukprot:comp22819_c1_seq1/m.35837 comp22819_c1_seq1/g.35837  ORF comp22819_c1_seq1/g.35837 comp22819_c1_seq1/m.35837 type:complete len:402 (-) comp22819_c1_seq1:126-1331(-)
MKGPLTVDCASTHENGVPKPTKQAPCQVVYMEVPTKQVYTVCSESEDVSSSDEALDIDTVRSNMSLRISGSSQNTHHHHSPEEDVVEHPCIVVSPSPHADKVVGYTISTSQSSSWRDLADSCQMVATELEDVSEDLEGEKQSQKRVRWSHYNVMHCTYSSSSYNRRTKERRYTEREMAAVRKELDDLHEELFPNRDYYIVGAPELLRDEPGAFEKVCTKFVNMYESSHQMIARNMHKLSQKTLMPSKSTSSCDSKHQASTKRRWSVDASVLSLKGLHHTNVRESFDLAKLKRHGSLGDAQSSAGKLETGQERAKSGQSSPDPNHSKEGMYEALNIATMNHELQHAYVPPPSTLHAPHVPVRSSFEIRSAQKQPHVVHPRPGLPSAVPAQVLGSGTPINPTK